MKLIFTSIFIGVGAGLVTIYFLPAQYELLLWILLIIAGGVLAQSNHEVRPFRKGFWLANSIGMTITLTHVLLIDAYAAGHEAEVLQLDKISIGSSRQLTLLAIAPIYWAVFGILTGLAALAWTRLRNK